jgi:hypothetical protein
MQNTDTLPCTPEILAVMGVTKEELRANQSRQLSPRQRQRLQNLFRRNIALGIALFVLLAFVATVCIYISQRNQQIIFGFLGVLVTVINAIAMGYWGRSMIRLNGDLRPESPVEIYEGFIKRVVRPNGQINQYVLQLGGLEFSVTKEVFKVFRHEKLYQLLATTYSDILLSAECLEPQCQETPQDWGEG